MADWLTVSGWKEFKVQVHRSSVVNSIGGNSESDAVPFEAV